MAGNSRLACFLQVLGVPTHVIKYGKITAETKSLFLVIPGKFIGKDVEVSSIETISIYGQLCKKTDLRHISKRGEADQQQRLSDAVVGQDIHFPIHVSLGELPEYVCAKWYKEIVTYGNPGAAEYYDQFMSELYKSSKYKVPVWAVSHAGHVTPDSQSEYLNNKSLSLDGQIKHKIKFIDDNIPSHVTLYLIGHSIGCYIILKMIDELNDRGHKVGRCFQLFPTIERMAVSPNGKIYTPVLKYMRWIAVWLVLMISWLPEQLKLAAIRYHFKGNDTPQCVYDATLRLVDSFPVSNSLYMANQEMQIVDKLDINLVKKHLNCLSFYYGQTDGWCPQQYFRDIKEIFPDGDFRLCKAGHDHAFVVSSNSNTDIAQIIWDWAQPYLKI